MFDVLKDDMSINSYSNLYMNRFFVVKLTGRLTSAFAIFLIYLKQI